MLLSNHSSKYSPVVPKVAMAAWKNDVTVGLPEVLSHTAVPSKELHIILHRGMSHRLLWICTESGWVCLSPAQNSYGAFWAHK